MDKNCQWCSGACAVIELAIPFIEVRDAKEPAVEVVNLPPDAEAKDIEPLFRELNYHSIKVEDVDGGRRAVVVLREMKDARLACTAISRKVVGDRHVEVREFDKLEFGEEFWNVRPA